MYHGTYHAKEIPWYTGVPVLHTPIKSYWDNHKKCINCSHCSENLLAPHVAAGLIPSGNFQKREELIFPEREPCPKRSLLMCLFHQTKRKRNMGTLPLMALLPGVRPKLVATPWVLVPKGIQVHRPMASGHQSPGIRRPTNHPPGMPRQWPSPANHPMEKKTYLNDWACPVTGHRACPVTEHQKSSPQPI